MRIVLQVFPALTICCAATGIGLEYAANGTGGDTSPYFGYGLLVIALAFLLAVATAIIGIVATAMHRQFGWMVIVLAAGLVPFGGAIVLGLITPLLVPQQQQTLPVGCKPPPGTPVPAGCQTGPPSPSGFVDFVNAVDPLLYVAAPILVALVVFTYSFRMHDVQTPVGVPYSQRLPRM
jgi:hypothetical protein